MKKEYETPDIYIEEYDIENSLGNLCFSGVVDQIPYVFYNDGEIE